MIYILNCSIIYTSLFIRYCQHQIDYTILSILNHLYNILLYYIIYAKLLYFISLFYIFTQNELQNGVR